MRTSVGWLVTFATLIVAATPGCRIFRAEEWNRRDVCAETLPLLREVPERPYRVIKVVRADNDDGLAWEACAEQADAVISLGLSSGTKTAMGAVPVGRGAVAFGKTSPDDHIVGYAIRFTDGASRGRGDTVTPEATNKSNRSVDRF
jgi:hypothetical protein